MIKCLICDKSFKMLNTHLERTHNIRIKDYKHRFGQDTPLRCMDTINKHKENCLSPYSQLHWEKKGVSPTQAAELTNRYINKHSQKARVYSPRCIEHWLNKGFDEETAKEKVSNYQRRDLTFFVDRYGTQEGIRRFKNKMKKMHDANSFEGLKKRNLTPEYKDHRSLKYFINRYGNEEGYARYKHTTQNQRWLSPRCVEYWKKQGFTLFESKLAVSKFQRRGLDTFVKKHGTIEGFKRYKQWSFGYRTSSKKRTSKESELFFENLFTYCSMNNIHIIREFRISRGNGKNYFYDVYIPSANLIFEYDGKCFHADPRAADDEWVGAHGMTYQQSLKYDTEKQRFAENNGFNVIRIHSNYKSEYDVINILQENLNK